MKTYYIFIAALALSLTSCTSSKWASADSYSDDLYFNANDKPLTVSNEYIPVYEDKDLKKDNRKEVNSMQSGYIKENPNYSMEQVTDDFSNLQTNYTQLLTNDSINDIDTVLYYNDETGYWVDGFEGSAMDLDYATRLIRFHGPFMGVPYWSPVYTDVLYSNSWDWNVYVDGNYVYAFPTYTNSFYWNSGFNTGFGYGRFGFGMGYSYWNPWYPPYMGYPGYGWGYPGYGWGYPGYGCGYPGYGPGYPGHPIHPGYPSDGNYYYGSRVTNPTSGRMSPVDENITNHRSATSTALKSTPSSRTTRTISADNNMVITKGTNSYTRVARSNQVKPGSDKKSVSNTNNNTRSSSNGSVNIRTTRKSYSSYSKSASTKRPTFNRPTTSRSSSTTTNSNSSSGSRSRTIYSAPRRSSSTSSRSSKTSSSSSKSTYRSGSSKSSAYSPSKSTSRSSSKSSYTSTPSSSSRSSGSSYSSGSSSRSSGGSSRSSGGSSRSTRGSR